eukprot:8400801-Pyramimonas_sp.AAC.1
MRIDKYAALILLGVGAREPIDKAQGQKKGEEVANQTAAPRCVHRPRARPNMQSHPRICEPRGKLPN